MDDKERLAKEECLKALGPLAVEFIQEQLDRANKAERAILEADEVLCAVSSHGEHEHQIKSHADSLPDVYRHQAIGVEKALKILSRIQHDIIERGQRKGLGS